MSGDGASSVQRLRRGRPRGGGRAPAGWPRVIVLDPFTAGLALARRMVRLGAQTTMVMSPGDLFVDRARGVEAIIAPFDSQEPSWMDVLAQIGASGEEAVVLPATDRSCELLLGAAAELPPNLLMFERQSAAHTALMNKERADAIARRAGVPVPWTARVSSAEELQAVLGQASWPCVVKPILSHEWRELYGGERVFLVRDAEEAASRLARPLADGVGMLLSQYIPGGDDDVEEAIVVRLADGSYPVQFGCHKLRQYPPGFGVTAVGEASPLPRTTEIAKRVLDEAGFVGVAGVETKRDAETGERWFLEVNVRIPGQWGLGDSCGVDASARLVSALAGRPLAPQPALREGVRLVLPDIDAHVVRGALLKVSPRQRPALALRMLASYRGARNFGLLDLRDPGPGLAWAGLLARRAIGRLTGRTVES